MGTDNEERPSPPPGPESRSAAGRAGCSHRADHSQGGWIKSCRGMNRKSKGGGAEKASSAPRATSKKLRFRANRRTWLSLFSQLWNVDHLGLTFKNDHLYIHGIESLACQDTRCCSRSLRPIPNFTNLGTLRACACLQSYVYVTDGT